MTAHYPEAGPPGHDEGRPGKSGPAASNFNPTLTVPHAAPSIPTVEGYLAGLGPVPRPTSCLTCAYGLAFEDGRKRCPRHRTDADRALVRELNRRGRAIGLKPHPRIKDERQWPYGCRSDVAMRRRLLDWAETGRLRYADRSHGCVAWLTASGRCPGVQRCVGLSRSILRWLDHQSSWTGPAGLRLVIGQPHNIDVDDAPELRTLAESEGLHLAILPPERGWYGGYQTHLVLLAGFQTEQGSAA